MKRIVSIIAVSLMLLASCGKTKDIIIPELNKNSEGSRNSDFSGNNAPIVKHTVWEDQRGEIYAGVLAMTIFAVVIVASICQCPGFKSDPNF